MSNETPTEIAKDICSAQEVGDEARANKLIEEGAVTFGPDKMMPAIKLQTRLMVARRKIKVAVAEFSAAKRDDFESRGLTYTKEGEELKSKVVNLDVRRNSAAYSLAHVEVLVGLIRDVLLAYSTPYWVSSDSEEGRAIERDFGSYTTPRKFTDLSIDVQALTRALASHIEDNGSGISELHPYSEVDVDRHLQASVMTLCKPPPGAPERMSEKEVLKAYGIDDD